MHRRQTFRDGWVWLVVTSLAQAYLVFFATLAVIAVAPSVFSWSTSVVQSSSMEPVMSPGDVVLASELPSDQPVPLGTVATFMRGDTLVVHRIVAMEGSGIITAGDANEQLDSEQIVRGDIVGIGRLLVPAVGLPGMWLAHGDWLPLLGWAALTVAAIAAVAFGTRRNDSEGESEPEVPVDATGTSAARPVHAVVVLLVGAALVAGVTMVPQQGAEAAFTARTSAVNNVWKAKKYSTITIGRASGFGALAGSSVTNSTTFNTSIGGSVGTTPGTGYSGFWPWDVTGSVELNTASAKAAMADAAAAAAALRERPTTQRIAPTLAGTLTPGVYESTTGAFALPSSLILDAKGDSSARFVFFTSGNLTLAQRSSIQLAGGAQAANVWWVVGGSFTAGSSVFTRDTTAVGNFIVTGGVTVRGTDVTGRLVSRSGSISLGATTIEVPA